MTLIPTSYLAEAQGWRCCYCGFIVIRKVASRPEKRAALAAGHRTHRGLAKAMRAATRDHIIPRCEGGTDTRENLVAACWWCNQYRGNRPADEAFARIRRLIRRGSHPHQVWQRTGHFPRMKSLGNILRTPVAEAAVCLSTPLLRDGVPVEACA